jgi:hypothetical protein
VADFYAARSEIIPPLPWPTFAPPFSLLSVKAQWSPFARKIPPYAIGAVGAFWVIERVWAFAA